MKSIFTAIVILICSFSIAQAQVPSYVPSNGLVGWWPFNGNANDESGNGNNGTVNGATLTSDRNGTANSAYSFDGLDDWISCSQAFNDWQDFSFSIWVYHTKGINNSGLLSDATIDAGNDLYINLSDNTIGLKADKIGGTVFQCPLPEVGYNPSPLVTNLSLGNSWHHLVFVVTVNEVRVFLNSSLTSILPLGGSNVGYHALNPVFGKVSDEGYSIQFYQGSLDDIGIWNRALDSCEIKDLYFASLGNCCQASFSSQPQNQNANSGTNATFIAQSSSANPIYQWQSNTGSGWQNLSNAGQYSGVNNDTLSVTNLSAANNNQLFRCILTSGACSDTSAAATLSVSQTNGLTTLQSEIISIYPNPATNQINIVSSAARYPLSYKVYNELGQALLIGDLKASTTSIDISSLAPGNYMLVVGTKHVSFVKNKI